MTLDEALVILARIHTHDDGMVGFCVVAGAGPEWLGYSRFDYIEAWKAVRMHLHMNVNPAPERTEN